MKRRKRLQRLRPERRIPPCARRSFRAWHTIPKRHLRPFARLKLHRRQKHCWFMVQSWQEHCLVRRRVSWYPCVLERILQVPWRKRRAKKRPKCWKWKDDVRPKRCTPYPFHLFASAFVESPKVLRLILAHCNRNKCPLTPSLRRSLLELTLAEWNDARRTGDTEAEKLRRKEAITVSRLHYGGIRMSLSPCSSVIHSFMSLLGTYRCSLPRYR